MAPPVNISFATATDLGSLPVTITQTADDAGTTYPLYFKFVAEGIVTGAFGLGDLASYNVITRPYDITEAQLIAGGSAIQATNRRIQFPTTIGDVYYLVCSQTAGNPSPAELTLNVQTAPTSTVPVGSLAVPDDTDGFPLALLSSTSDYTALRYVSPWPAGESGDVLSNGTVLVSEDSTAKTHLFNASYQSLSTHTFSSLIRIRTCLDTQHFCVALNTNPTVVYTVDAAGTVTGPETLTAMTSCIAAAFTNDEAFIYHAFTGTNQAVRVWEVGVGAAANLAAGIANHVIVDILVMSDDSILVGYYKSTVTRAFIVKQYSAAGATLNTYTLATPAATTAPRLAYAIDDPNSFWVGNHPATAVGSWQFQNIKISDGSILTTHLQEEFETGAYQSAQTATPLATFGASFSCPFWITRSAATPSTQTFTIRRQRRFLLPSSEDNKRMQIPRLELLMRTGIGLLPDAAGSTTPLGVIPEVRQRISKTGGKTWSPERTASAGERGHYDARVYWLQATGNYRNAVCEITVDEPVDWQILAAIGDPVEGSS